MKPGLSVYHRSELVFSHDGKWLHPIFALERFLIEHPIPREQLSVKDHIIGKAAAMLHVRLGIRTVHGEIMSRPALEFLQRSLVRVTYDDLVDRIECATEEILADVDELSEAYDIIAERASRSRTI